MENAAKKQQYSATTSASMEPARNQRQVRMQGIPAVFNPRDFKHKELLNQWCQEMWPSTFRKSMQSGNAMHYHGCCTSFSRRAFCKLAGHPELQTCRLSKMPSFRDVCSATDLYHWLLGMLIDDSKRGLTVYFPAINRLHFDTADNENNEPDDEMDSLAKRVEHLTENEKKLTQQVQQLKTENEKLLLATKTWYVKYQDLIERTDNHQNSAFMTPVNKRSKSNFDSFDEIF